MQIFLEECDKEEKLGRGRFLEGGRFMEKIRYMISQFLDNPSQELLTSNSSNPLSRTGWTPNLMIKRHSFFSVQFLKLDF